jgi:hypothetical protein
MLSFAIFFDSVLMAFENGWLGLRGVFNMASKSETLIDCLLHPNKTKP